MVQDITAARSVQEALREKEARAQMLIGSIDEIVFELDAQGTYVNIWTANDALLVRPRAQLLGRRVTDVLPEEVTRSFFQVLPGVLEEGQPATIEYPLDLPDGRHWFLARINPLSRAAGRPPTVCFLARDITERKRIEESLERNDRMKTEFISTAAHELRTPLTTLLGFTELLMQPRFRDILSTEEKGEFLREIYAKGRQLTRIVEDLLDLSRLETGQTLPLRRQPIDLGALLEKEIRSFQGRFPSHCLELVLTDPCPPDLPVDAGRLEQVVENLLDNAIKFSPAGCRITLTGRLIEEGYLLAVRDEGRGLTPEQRERVFDKFYRADASNTAAPGLGLGMCIGRQIVEAHGGRIWVESEVGRGTTVFFTLPLASR